MSEYVKTVRNYVSSKIAYLQSLSGTGKGNALMAELRHGLGKRPGETTALWGIIFDGIPESLLGKDKPSDAEWAIYTALTLYSYHPNQIPKQSLGSAAAQLVKKEDDDIDRVLNRLKPVVTARDNEDVACQLRYFVQILKSEEIPLDYVKLAGELSLFSNREMAADIKLSWARDFYAHINTVNKKEKETN